MGKRKNLELDRADTENKLGVYIRRNWSHGDSLQLRFGYATGGKMVIFLYNLRTRQAVLINETKDELESNRENSTGA